MILPINIYGAKLTGMDGYVFNGNVIDLREKLKIEGIL